MPLNIVRQDITKMDTDAIVNAANTHLAMGGGVCGAIFSAAGAKKLQAACNKIAPIKTGEAVITPGFNLHAKYIIHTAGPVYSPSDKENSRRLLRLSYINSLELAYKNKCESIAFPLISSGIFGYPKDEALKVASSAIEEFLEKYDMDVYLVMFDRASFVLSNELLGDVKSYIDEHYVEENIMPRSSLLDVEYRAIGSVYADEACMPDKELEDVIKDMEEPFNVMLLNIIDRKGKTDPQVYKKANIDRKLFSKIRSKKGYIPSKRTVMALAVALELDLDEADELLKRAGYAFSHSSKLDVIVEYFIINKIYDIYRINEVLFQYEQPLLGAGT